MINRLAGTPIDITWLLFIAGESDGFVGTCNDSYCPDYVISQSVLCTLETVSCSHAHHLSSFVKLSSRTLCRIKCLLGYVYTIQYNTTGHDGTRRDTTGHDGTRRDKTRQDATRRDRTRRDATGRDATGCDRMRRDRTRQDATPRLTMPHDATRHNDL